MTRTPFTVLLLGVALTLGACDKMANTSQSIQSITAREFSDTKSSWSEFFTYHPPVPDPLPQTRYCYQTQSDVVCYDSEQPRLTSRLVGYQDGERASWIQPGGGSLGASGGDAIALRPINTAQYNTGVPSVAGPDDAIIDTGPIYSSDAPVIGVANSNQVKTGSTLPVTAKEHGTTHPAP